MSRSKKARKGRGYHHGNLREALVQAALDLIGDKGPAGFTFAEAARWAGVSPAAPYRHFRDRDALMADVAKRGFERFTEDLTRAWDQGRPEPFRAFENVGRAYLAFARTEPAYYAAMFEAQLPGEGQVAGLYQFAAEVGCARVRRLAPAFGHVLVELGLVLGMAQAFEERLELALLLFETAHRLVAIFIEGTVAAR